MSLCQRTPRAATEVARSVESPCDCQGTAGCRARPRREPTRQALGSFAEAEKLFSPAVDSDPDARREGSFDKNVSKYFENTSLHFFLEPP